MRTHAHIAMCGRSCVFKNHFETSFTRTFHWHIYHTHLHHAWEVCAVTKMGVRCACVRPENRSQLMLCSKMSKLVFLVNLWILPVLQWSLILIFGGKNILTKVTGTKMVVQKDGQLLRWKMAILFMDCKLKSVNL